MRTEDSQCRGSGTSDPLEKREAARLLSAILLQARMKRRRRRVVATGLLGLILALAVLLPLAGYGLYWLTPAASAQDAAPETAAVTNERSNFWRAVREGAPGYSAIRTQGANVLVQPGGNAWREFREGPIKSIAAWLFGGVLAILLLYHLIHGRNRLLHRPSGRKVKRWNGFERLVHWFTAISFIILAVTGLSMMFGRQVLIPLLGKAGFAAWAEVSIQVHNVVGPAFSIGILLMIIMWIWYNIPTAVDLRWLASGGGVIGKAHPSAGRLNAGEKLWFWMIAIGGTIVCLTGLVLVAPGYDIRVPVELSSRDILQQASVWHLVAAVIWIAIAIGHIYIGTAGTEGAFEGMATGYVSEEWARQHHDLWFESLQQQTGGGFMSRAELAALREQEQARIAASEL